MQSFPSHLDLQNQKNSCNSSPSSVRSFHDLPHAKHKKANEMKIFSRSILSPKTYLLLVILQFLHYCCSADAGTINVHPATQHVNISGLVTFNCLATGANTRWTIKKAFVEYPLGPPNYRTHNHTEDDYNFLETIQHGTNADDIHNMYLEIPATLENNMTQVSCVVWVDIVTHSDLAVMIVQGGPAAPEPVLRMITNTDLILEWDPPFTWPYTTISHYNISVNNSLDNWNRTTYSDTSLAITSMEGECEEYTFSVLANSELGDGQFGRVTGGFPKVPQMPVDVISHSVTFKHDGSPIILLSIKLPVICSYQRMEYVVILKELSERVVTIFGPTSVLYEDMETVTLTADDSQLKDEEFLNINVTFTLLDVEEEFSTSHVLSQEKLIKINMGLVDGTDDKLLGTERVILICGVGGTVVLTLAMLFVVFVLVCIYKRKKRGVYRSNNGTPSPKLSPMVTNPIYEGQPIYETVDPRFRTISTPTPTHPPLLPNTKCPPIAMESPYNHDPNYAYLQTRIPSSFPPSLNESEYTIMASAGALGKRVHSSGESNLDKDISEVDRYVPQPSTLVSEC